jgi:hypothetical protein
MRTRISTGLILSLLAAGACKSGAAKPGDPPAPKAKPLDLIVVVESHQLFIGPPMGDLDNHTVYDDVVHALDGLAKQLPADARVRIALATGDNVTFPGSDVAAASFTGAALGPQQSFAGITAPPHYTVVLDAIHRKLGAADHPRAVLVIGRGCDLVDGKDAARDAVVKQIADDGVAIAAVFHDPFGSDCTPPFAAPVNVHRAATGKEIEVLVNLAVGELQHPAAAAPAK